MRPNEISADEEHFHDGWARHADLNAVMVDESFSAATAPENRWIMSRLPDVRDKRLLDMGAGMGEASIYFAKHGARVTAVDLSFEMLQTVRGLAARHGVEVETVQADSDSLPFIDGYFDIVYAANVLHHCDIDGTLKEAARTLKSGGWFASWDPLAHNPLIKVYRMLASAVRTKGEHPLKIRDVNLFKKHFACVEFETTWLLTLWIFLKFYLLDRVGPNEERYWKKILTDHKRLDKTFSLLERCDKAVMRFFPFTRRYCWNLVVAARKQPQ